MNFIIVEAGVREAASSGVYSIKPNKYKFGDQTSSSFSPSESTMDVGGTVVHSGDLSKYNIEDGVLTYKIRLDSDVGPFSYGNIGLFLDDTLIAVGVNDALTDKTNPADGSGNIITEVIKIGFNNALENFDIPFTIHSNIPRFDSFSAMDGVSDPALHSHDLLLVNNSDNLGKSAVLIKQDNGWGVDTHTVLFTGTVESSTKTSITSTDIPPVNLIEYDSFGLDDGRRVPILGEGVAEIPSPFFNYFPVPPSYERNKTIAFKQVDTDIRDITIDIMRPSLPSKEDWTDVPDTDRFIALAYYDHLEIPGFVFADIVGQDNKASITYSSDVVTTGGFWKTAFLYIGATSVVSYRLKQNNTHNPFMFRKKEYADAGKPTSYTDLCLYYGYQFNTAASDIGPDDLGNVLRKMEFFKIGTNPLFSVTPTTTFDETTRTTSYTITNNNNITIDNDKYNIYVMEVQISAEYTYIPDNGIQGTVYAFFAKASVYNTSEIWRYDVRTSNATTYRKLSPTHGTNPNANNLSPYNEVFLIKIKGNDWTSITLTIIGVGRDRGSLFRENISIDSINLYHAGVDLSGDGEISYKDNMKAVFDKGKYLVQMTSGDLKGTIRKVTGSEYGIMELDELPSAASSGDSFTVLQSRS